MSNSDSFLSAGQPVRMFDADCKNIVRLPQRTVFASRVGFPVIPKVHADTSTHIALPSETIAIPQVKTIYRWDLSVMPLLYLAVTMSGLTVLGILGSAIGMTRTLLSLALYKSALTPILFMQCLLSIENVPAVAMGVCVVLYTTTSISLSLVFDTNVFTSISFCNVVLFHGLSGGANGKWVVQLFIFSVFIYISYWESLIQYNRGDTIGLVLLPSIKIILTGISGAVSTMSFSGLATSIVVI
jgi:hypothetical protein